MTFSELFLKILELLRPYHAMPCVDTLLALQWLNHGLGPPKQILPVMEQTVARKLTAGKAVTSMHYYDQALRGLKQSDTDGK